ncbi:RCC1/BLIP-II [Eremomyces bilateralis CBS 781.70]|uniref:RCC1/BLIP-II n=1 Tax=Eremomyces bilateralis CBS 781.70 TaxID=1392243 RepID=A0A6G1FW30_9PEZI|nr:RCC1/BLIP-II [Eremomyces bilateralis CBS 781.70]KAF1809829.1 RCC1/BLIP-II [Eremomyces bilateralis CBS 781.70]
MSGYLWNSFYQDDVEGFRSFLSAGQGGMKTTSNRVKTSSSIEATGRSLSFGSPGSLGTSPVLAKQKKAHGYSAQDGLTRQDINRRDHLGRTLLHLIASSRHDSTIDFATALLDFPLTDIYLQDYENGWTALHRAFYFGNVSIARSILWRETQDVLNHAHGTPKHPQPLIKIKDHEGNGPYDLLFMTLAAHSRRSTIHRSIREGTEGIRDDTSSTDETLDPTQSESIACISEQLGDEVFTFGSNKNVTLGFGDEDDRQFPERITLRRPVGLIEKQFLRYLESRSHFYGSDTNEGNMRMRNGYVDIAEVPFSVKSIPIRFRDIQMSKFHTAILTTDQESNLYICGHGKGGRLGFGDERTRYQFACVDSGGLGTKEVVQVALGHNHTLAVTSDGSVYSWGMNTFGQLGYQLSNIRPNEEPLQLVPRQIYGTLKRERVAGVAASRIHSVVFTPLSLFTFGKNEGQLGIVDSDARSLSSQASPRKVAASLFSTTISTVAAIDRATICLLANHEVWVFANYGYRRLTFPLDGFSNFFMHQVHTIPSWEDIPNRICHITGGGNTICAMSSMGEVFTCVVSLPTEMGDSHASTTNPSKIKGSFSQPRRVWSIKKGHMSARNVAVDQDGSIILATEAGTVWRQVKRSKAKHTTASEIGSQSKDYKFTRIPNLTRVCKVRASAFGAYAVIRQEYDVTKTDILDTGSPLWEAYARLMPFEELVTYATTGDHPIKLSAVEPKVQQLFSITKGIESLALKDTKDFPLEPIVVYTSLGNWGIPIHRWLLVGRSNVIRRSLNSHAHMDFLHVEETENCTRLQFEGLDPMTLFNFVYWLYTDEVVECWQFPKNARARNVRADLIRLAHRLELTGLEFAVRQIDSRRRLDDDMRIAYSDAELFTDADVLVELEDGQVSAHSEILCQRCPFFDGLFKGRTGGLWLQGRTSESGKVSIDLKHFSSETFGYVLRHIYSDAGIELFDNIQCPKVEDFLDRVLDVMAIANELLLDRLSLVCQKVIGKHVNLRNVCELLNVIAPSPAGAFRHAALDYICFNLEVLLQNGYLDELDNDLLIEVNQRVREEQRYHARAKEDDEELLLRWPELSKRRIRWGEVSIDPAMLGEKSVRDASKFPSTSFVNPLDHHPLSLPQSCDTEARNIQLAMENPTIEDQLIPIDFQWTGNFNQKCVNSTNNEATDNEANGRKYHTAYE